jgi:hypothetical protein
MKNVNLYKPTGETFQNYPGVTSYNVENGVLSFRWERVPKDQSTTQRVVTTLPFFIEDDLIG